MLETLIHRVVDLESVQLNFESHILPGDCDVLKPKQQQVRKEATNLIGIISPWSSGKYRDAAKQGRVK